MFRCAGCGDERQAFMGCSRHGKPRPQRAPVVLVLPDRSKREFFDCPANLIPARMMRYLSAYSHHKNGHPWYPGSAGEWPARYVRALAIISDEEERIREIEGERGRAAASMGRRGRP